MNRIPSLLLEIVVGTAPDPRACPRCVARRWGRWLGALAVLLTFFHGLPGRAGTLYQIFPASEAGGTACSAPFTMTIYGTGFSSSASQNTVYWGGDNWGPATTFDSGSGSGTNVSFASITIDVPCSARGLLAGEEFRTELISVKVTGGGPAFGDRAFTILGPNVAAGVEVNGTVANTGSTFFQSMDFTGGAGVNATLTLTGSGSVIATALNYNTDPSPGSTGLVFDVGSGWTDLQIEGPVSTADSLTATFYYPKYGPANPADQTLVLQYFDGVSYTPVLISGLPIFPTSTVDGPSYFPFGGYFQVVFKNNGTTVPQLSQLTGTIFTMAPAPLSASPATLWPPNHKMVVVSVDARGGQVVSVTSNEPDSGQGNGDKPNDAVILGPLSVALRAERGNAGGGRAYTVIVEFGDGSRNVAVIRVPHDFSGKTR